MLVIRLNKIGKKNAPSYRIVVTEKTAGPKSGNFLEILGSYNLSNKAGTRLKPNRIKYWLSQGAQVSDTVHNLLVKEGVIEGPKRKIKIKPSAKKEESTEEAVSEEAESEVSAEETATEEKTEI